VLNLTLRSFATLLYPMSVSESRIVNQKEEHRMVGKGDEGWPYLLLASFEAVSAPPLAFELRYLPACLEGC
jgi:hypothetical protein